MDNIYIFGHKNPDTDELLPNQLTEEDCRVQLQRLLDANVFITMHNGKFDYQVIKCTTGCQVQETAVFNVKLWR